MASSTTHSSSSTSLCPACLHNSSFQIVQSHQIYRILLKHLLKSTCYFWFSSLVSLHVSAPYKRTIFTFDPKTLNLVLAVSDMDCYVSLTLQTPWCSTQFPFLLAILISNLHLSSSFIFPAVITPSPSLPFVFVYLSSGQPLQAVLSFMLCFVLHILYYVWQKGQILQGCCVGPLNTVPPYNDYLCHPIQSDLKQLGWQQAALSDPHSHAQLFRCWRALDRSLSGQ